MAQGELTVYRACTPVVDAQYDPETDHTISEAIVNALASAIGVHPTDLPPIHEYADLEAIDLLLHRQDGADSVASTVIGFTIEEWNVFVRGDGRIRICDGTRHTDPEPVFASNYV